MTVYGTGWLRDPPAKYRYVNRDKLKAKVFGKSDLRMFSVGRQDQGNTQSCCAQAVVKALEIKRSIKYGTQAHVDLSRMQVWSLAREDMDPPRNREDYGTYLMLCCDVIRRLGVAPESDWPWDTSKLDVSPSWRSMRHAYLHRIQAFERIGETGQARAEMCRDLLASGQPIVFGTPVGADWNTYSGGILGLPNEIVDYHAITLVGWDGFAFIGENSWGSWWGEGGFFRMSPAVIESSWSEDFWTVIAPWEEA